MLVEICLQNARTISLPDADVDICLDEDLSDYDNQEAACTSFSHYDTPPEHEYSYHCSYPPPILNKNQKSKYRKPQSLTRGTRSSSRFIIQ